MLFLLPLWEDEEKEKEEAEGGGEGEVFVPPYKSQYPLVSAVVRERRGRLNVRERGGGEEEKNGGTGGGRQLVANGI